jgi:Transposase
MIRVAVAENRTEASLRSCLGGLGQEFYPRVKFVRSDIWQPYLKVIGERMGQAMHVLDRFYIMKQIGNAPDEIRAEEAKRPRRDGYEPVLKMSRFGWGAFISKAGGVPRGVGCVGFREAHPHEIGYSLAHLFYARFGPARILGPKTRT